VPRKTESVHGAIPFDCCVDTAITSRRCFEEPTQDAPVAALTSPTFWRVYREKHVRAAAAMDAIAADVCSRRKGTALAYLASPATCYPIPAAAAQDAVDRMGASPCGVRSWLVPPEPPQVHPWCTVPWTRCEPHSSPAFPPVGQVLTSSDPSSLASAASTTLGYATSILGHHTPRVHAHSLSSGPTGGCNEVDACGWCRDRQGAVVACCCVGAVRRVEADDVRGGGGRRGRVASRLQRPVYCAGPKLCPRQNAPGTLLIRIIIAAMSSTTLLLAASSLLLARSHLLVNLLRLPSTVPTSW
jgi:hypothetical protein